MIYVGCICLMKNVDPGDVVVLQKVGVEVPYPGIDHTQYTGPYPPPKSLIRQHKYYQWVSFFLFFQVCTSHRPLLSLARACKSFQFFCDADGGGGGGGHLPRPTRATAAAAEARQGGGGRRRLCASLAARPASNALFSQLYH
jgi:hypothetical protein